MSMLRNYQVQRVKSRSSCHCAGLSKDFLLTLYSFIRKTTDSQNLKLVRKNAAWSKVQRSSTCEMDNTLCVSMFASLATSIDIYSITSLFPVFGAGISFQYMGAEFAGKKSDDTSVIKVCRDDKVTCMFNFITNSLTISFYCEKKYNVSISEAQSILYFRSEDDNAESDIARFTLAKRAHINTS